jgi:hypothetical protein
LAGSARPEEIRWGQSTPNIHGSQIAEAAIAGLNVNSAATATTAILKNAISAAAAARSEN